MDYYEDYDNEEELTYEELKEEADAKLYDVLVNQDYDEKEFEIKLKEAFKIYRKVPRTIIINVPVFKKIKDMLDVVNTIQIAKLTNDKISIGFTVLDAFVDEAANE